MATNPIIPVEYTTGRGQNYPVVSSIASPPQASVFGAVQGQLTSTFSTVASATFPVAAVGSVVIQVVRVPITSWPQTLTLTGTQTASVVPTVVQASAQSNLLIGMPYVVLLFGAGSPLYAPGVGNSIFTLKNGVTYKAPAISVTITAMVITAYVNPIVVPFAISATLLSHT